jgi:hypothetical protein
MRCRNGYAVGCTHADGRQCCNRKVKPIIGPIKPPAECTKRGCPGYLPIKPKPVWASFKPDVTPVAQEDNCKGSDEKAFNNPRLCQLKGGRCSWLEAGDEEEEGGCFPNEDKCAAAFGNSKFECGRTFLKDVKYGCVWNQDNGNRGICRQNDPVALNDARDLRQQLGVARESCTVSRPTAGGRVVRGQMCIKMADKEMRKEFKKDAKAEDAMQGAIADHAGVGFEKVNVCVDGTDRPTREPDPDEGAGGSRPVITDTELCKHDVCAALNGKNLSWTPKDEACDEGYKSGCSHSDGRKCCNLKPRPDCGKRECGCASATLACLCALAI